MKRKIYKSIRKFLPEYLKTQLSQMVFLLSKKPFVKTDNIDNNKKFPNSEKGGLIISGDFELAWAWRYAKAYQKPLKVGDEMAARARTNFPKLLQLFDQYNIPITWATVGHLFLKECNKGDHDWMHKIPYFENNNWRFKKGDWFEHDPYSDYSSAPHWYAPDLIKQILNSDLQHEIGSHTFTHIDFSDKNCPENVAADETKACIDAMNPYNLKPKSMVFPGGTFGNIKVLKNYGFEIYRKNIHSELAYPFRDEYGLLVSPTSNGFGKIHPSWSRSYYIKRLKIYIDKAIKTNTIAHLWFHPSLDEWTVKNIMPVILEYANEKREKGDLWIGTMEDIANYINQNKIV